MRLLSRYLIPVLLIRAIAFVWEEARSALQARCDLAQGEALYDRITNGEPVFVETVEDKISSRSTVS